MIILEFFKSLFTSKNKKIKDAIDKETKLSIQRMVDRVNDKHITDSNTFVSDRLKENTELSKTLKPENNNELYISERLIEFIKTHEGFSPTVYTCAGGKQTIGYGHVVYEYTDSIPAMSETSAEFLLKTDLFKIRRRLIQDLEGVLLTQGQFEALVSLSYNCGDLKKAARKGWAALMKKDIETAAIEFFSEERGLVHANKTKLQGLVNRRAAELTLWNK